MPPAHRTSRLPGVDGQRRDTNPGRAHGGHDPAIRGGRRGLSICQFVLAGSGFGLPPDQPDLPGRRVHAPAVPVSLGDAGRSVHSAEPAVPAVEFTLLFARLHSERVALEFGLSQCLAFLTLI